MSTAIEEPERGFEEPADFGVTLGQGPRLVQRVTRRRPRGGLRRGPGPAENVRLLRVRRLLGADVTAPRHDPIAGLRGAQFQVAC